jgi:hypothetical protein
MTSAVEDDFQAEQQIHASLRRVVDQAVPSIRLESCEDQPPALSKPGLQIEGLQIESRPTHTSPLKTPLSPMLPVYCSLKPPQQTIALRLMDDILSATGNQSGLDFSPVQENNADDSVRNFGENNILVSPHHPMPIGQDTQPKEERSGVSVVEWEAEQYSDPDISMKDASSSSPTLPWIKAETAWASTLALPKASSQVTNPWSIFASPTNLNGLKKSALSSDFCFGDLTSSTVATSQREAEKVGGFQACPNWLNKDVAPCQRSSMLELPPNGVRSFAVHESSDFTSRFLQIPSTSTFEGAGETASSREEGKINAHDDKQNGFTNDIQPDRLASTFGRSKSLQMRRLPESQCETAKRLKPSGTMKGAVYLPRERGLVAHGEKQNGFTNDLHPGQLAMASGQDKSLQMKRLSESQCETGMKLKPSGTAREAIPLPRKLDLVVRDDKQNDFFGGLHPSRMTLISEREPSPPKKMLSQSKWKPTGANLVQCGPVQGSSVQDIVQVPKESKLKEHIQKIETSICSSKKSSTNVDSMDGTQFAIEGIASLKKRYVFLDQSFPLCKAWFFALQEIAAILRTTLQYEYSPHTSDQQGYKIQLKTNFKVFRLRNYLSKKQGKEMITKKAVLYVIDGPFFFKQATPALNGRSFLRPFSDGLVPNLCPDFCRVNGLAAPTYHVSQHPEGTFSCSLQLDKVLSMFVDPQECWENGKNAIEDTAKMAMNALHRQGVTMEIERFSDAIPVAASPDHQPKSSKKRKAPMALALEEGRRISARIKENTGPEARDVGAPSRETGPTGNPWVKPIESARSKEKTGPKARHVGAPSLGTGPAGNSRVKTVEPRFKDDVQKFSQSKLGSARSSSRTRAGLMGCLRGILTPHERVGGKFISYAAMQPMLSFTH